MKDVCLAAVALALVGFGVGCGDGRIRCDPPELPDPSVTLSPDSVLAGTEVTVVASFDEPLFDPSFDLPFQDVVVVDAATDEWIGTFSDTWLDFEWRDGPIVSGVVLSGEVIDDRSIELTLEFPNELVDGAIVQVRATNDDPHCYAGTSGEAPLTVDFVL